LQSEGVIPASVRFQVSLPTPTAVLQAFVIPDQIAAVRPVYERALFAELARIVAGVPHERLAVQWDVCLEIAIWEGMFGPCPPEKQQSIIETLAALADLVPAGAELGYHLCYGDMNHKHFKEPADLAPLVRIANDLTAKARRRIDWIHMPVPRDRKDDAYFAPLRNLRLGAGSELYLGLVHKTDGLAGARARIAAAERVVPDFGIAAECGMGRRPPEDVPELLVLHGQIAEL
jgi:methionine synthase II (cobalamin-independent)